MKPSGKHLKILRNYNVITEVFSPRELQCEYRLVSENGDITHQVAERPLKISACVEDSMW